MNPIVTTTAEPLIVPQPRVPIAVRTATMGDVPFMDALQKRYHKQLGFFPRAQMEGYVGGGHVLVAEAGVEGRGWKIEDSNGKDRSALSSTLHPPSSPAKLGYVISKDRYLKCDELGVIYQLCVAPGHQRGLIGASLIKAVFERSAYGCRLYCCWCAQDLDANFFWESLGFVPIAFRTGGRKGRGARGKGQGATDRRARVAVCFPRP